MTDLKPQLASKLTQAGQLMAEQDFISALKLYEHVADVAGMQTVSLPMGYCHLAMQDFEAASPLLELAVQTLPHSAQLWCNLGVVRGHLKDFDGAMVALEKAVAMSPHYIPALFNLGNIHLELGCAQEGVKWLQKVLALDQNHMKAHFRLGDAYQQLYEFDLAYSHYKAAAEVDDSDPEPLCGLAALELTQGHLAAAKTIFLRAIEIDENCAEAHFNIGYINCLQGTWDEGLSSVRFATELEPENTAYWSMLLWLMTAHPTASPEEVTAEHLAFGERFYRPSKLLAGGGSRDETSPIRVGYLSAAFRHHVCMDFFLPLLENHSSSEVEVYCYNASAKRDSITESVKSLAEYWRDIALLGDAEAVKIILEDDLDILVDIDGHAGGNRIGVICEKPAPVIVNWLGYPNTTGLKAVDYRLVDYITDPIATSDPAAPESLVRLPTSFLIYKPLDDQKPAMEPPILSNGYCTFGCFNHPAKLNDEVFGAWSSILRDSPHSILALKNRLLMCEETQSIISQKFENLGVQKGRIIYLPYVDAQVDHLLHYNQIDIALDPFPYNGTTTTCEALWMGVPLITKLGDRHAARVGASLMTTIGSPELIGRTTNEYIESAVQLSKDKGRLQIYRSGLREKLNNSSLCDYAGFAARMEESLKNCATKAR